MRLVGGWPVQRLLLSVHHPFHEKLGRCSGGLFTSAWRSDQHHRALWARLHTGLVFHHTSLTLTCLTWFCRSFGGSRWFFLFTDSSNPDSSHWSFSVDGRSWLCHRGGVDVDRRLPVPLYKLGCRWYFQRKEHIFVKRATASKSNRINMTISPWTVKGNPDDYFGEDCLSILISSGSWNDDNCDNKRGYICKRRGIFLYVFYQSYSPQCFSHFWRKAILVFSGNTPEPPPPHDGMFHLTCTVCSALDCLSVCLLLCCVVLQVSSQRMRVRTLAWSFTAPLTASSTFSRPFTDAAVTKSVPMEMEPLVNSHTDTRWENVCILHTESLIYPLDVLRYLHCWWHVAFGQEELWQPSFLFSLRTHGKWPLPHRL